jgi:hypothetical protein
MNKNLIPSEELIKEWEQIEAKATHGPWSVDGAGIEGSRPSGGYQPVLVVQEDGAIWIEDRNLLFLETVRDAFPVLLKAFREQQTLIELWRKEIQFLSERVEMQELLLTANQERLEES